MTKYSMNDLQVAWGMSFRDAYKRRQELLKAGALVVVKGRFFSISYGFADGNAEREFSAKLVTAKLAGQQQELPL